LRNRMRTIGHRVMEIARTSRSKGPQVQERLKQGYRKLLTTTRKVVNQAKRFRKEIASGVKRAKDHEQKLVLQGLRKDLETMMPTSWCRRCRNTKSNSGVFRNWWLVTQGSTPRATRQN